MWCDLMLLSLLIPSVYRTWRGSFIGFLLFNFHHGLYLCYKEQAVDGLDRCCKRLCDSATWFSRVSCRFCCCVILQGSFWIKIIMMLFCYQILTLLFSAVFREVIWLSYWAWCSPCTEWCVICSWGLSHVYLHKSDCSSETFTINLNSDQSSSVDKISTIVFILFFSLFRLISRTRYTWTSLLNKACKC